MHGVIELQYKGQQLGSHFPPEFASFLCQFGSGGPVLIILGAEAEHMSECSLVHGSVAAKPLLLLRLFFEIVVLLPNT